MVEQKPLSDEQLAGIVVQRKQIKKLIENAWTHLEVAKMNLQPVIQSFSVGEKKPYADLTIGCAETIEMAQGLLNDLQDFV